MADERNALTEWMQGGKGIVLALVRNRALENRLKGAFTGRFALHAVCDRTEAEDFLDGYWGQISLVLIDFDIPDHEGEKFLLDIRQNKESVYLPVLVMSENAGTVAKALDHGANECLMLPLQDTSILALRCRNLIRLSESVQALERDMYDSLTGLLSTRGFLSLAGRRQEADPHPEEGYYVLFDLSQFKLFNVNFGNDRGDQVLIKTAEIISNVFGDDLIARFADDHFVVYTKNPSLDEAIRQVADQVRLLEKDYVLNIRAGVYPNQLGVQEPNNSINYAKIACDSIRSTSDVCCYYEKGQKEKAELYKYLADRVDQAAEEGWIQVWYQPVIRSLTGQLCSKEALTRWIDPERGFLSPGIFIPALEERHLIAHLDAYVIRKVCSDLKEQLDRGEEAVPVSFNLSRIDFTTGNPFNFVEKTRKEYGIPTDLLCVEITESTIMSDMDMIHQQIEQFRSAGYQVWMDDYGSGYSSLNVLKDFDFDEIKIDMVFLSSFSEKSKQIIKSSISMAKALGIHTLAEGVETKEQFEFLRGIGCEKIQGYYFGKPMSKDAFAEHMAELQIEPEPHTMRKYYEAVGLADLMSSASLALIEDDDGTLRLAYTNQLYRDALASMGTTQVAHAEKNLNAPGSAMTRAYRRYAEKAEQTAEPVVVVYPDRGQTMRLTLQQIASHGTRHMLRACLENLQIGKINERQHAIDSYLRILALIYDMANILHLDEDYAEVLIRNSSFHDYGEKIDGLDQLRHRYARESISPDDAERYLTFSDPATIPERIRHSKVGFLIASFDTLRSDGKTYEARLHLITMVPNTDNRLAVEFVRNTAIGEEAEE